MRYLPPWASRANRADGRKGTGGSAAPQGIEADSRVAYRVWLRISSSQSSAADAFKRASDASSTSTPGCISPISSRVASARVSDARYTASLRSAAARTGSGSAACSRQSCRARAARSAGTAPLRSGSAGCAHPPTARPRQKTRRISSRSWSSVAIQNTGTVGIPCCVQCSASAWVSAILACTYRGPTPVTSWWPAVTVTESGWAKRSSSAKCSSRGWGPHCARSTSTRRARRCGENCWARRRMPSADSACVIGARSKPRALRATKASPIPQALSGVVGTPFIGEA